MIPYDNILRIRTTLALFACQKSEAEVPLPSHFDPNLYITGAFDNFDHEEYTLSGINGTHDTSVLFQDEPASFIGKPNVSTTNVNTQDKAFTS